MQNYKMISNPDLTVGKNNKQRWNHAKYRRHGFHNAHNLFRRALMVRSRNVLVLNEEGKSYNSLVPDLQKILDHPAEKAIGY